MSSLLVLAIETSCDETSISILQFKNGFLRLLSNEISSQVKLHAKWGGVVPNLAAREHVKNIVPVFELALKNAGVSMQNIDFIAVTKGPGLIPALMVGANFAKTLSYIYEKPLIGIHHIEGHIYANFISDKISAISNDQFPISKQITNSKTEIKNSKLNVSKLIQNLKFKIQNFNTMFPALCLVVSGGHTQLVLMKNHLQYEIIGQTLDDAVGEAFDKVARILGIGYPGGPAIAQQAANFKFSILNFKSNSNDKISNNKTKEKSYEIQDTKYQIQLPRPMLNKPGFNFSFSGLKTAVLYEIKKNSGIFHPVKSADGGSALQKFNRVKDKKYIAAVCHEFQQAAIDVLIAKTLKAAEKYGPKTILLAGGVSANKELREQLDLAIKKFIPDTCYMIPDTSLTGDNAAMIAAAAAFRWQKMNKSQKKKSLNNWKNLQPDANLKLK